MEGSDDILPISKKISEDKKEKITTFNSMVYNMVRGDYEMVRDFFTTIPGVLEENRGKGLRTTGTLFKRFQNERFSDQLAFYALNAGLTYEELIDQAAFEKEEIPKKSSNVSEKFLRNIHRLTLHKGKATSGFMYRYESGLRVHNKMIQGSIMFVPVYSQLLRETPSAATGNDGKDHIMTPSGDLETADYNGLYDAFYPDQGRDSIFKYKPLSEDRSNSIWNEVSDRNVCLLTLNMAIYLLQAIQEDSDFGTFQNVPGSEGSSTTSDEPRDYTRLVLGHSQYGKSNEGKDARREASKRIAFLPVFIGRSLSLVDVTHKDSLNQIVRVAESLHEKAPSGEFRNIFEKVKLRSDITKLNIDIQRQPIDIDTVLDDDFNDDEFRKRYQEQARECLDCILQMSNEGLGVVRNAMGYDGIFGSFGRTGTVCLVNRLSMNGSISPNVRVQHIFFGVDCTVPKPQQSDECRNFGWQSFATIQYGSSKGTKYGSSKGTKNRSSKGTKDGSSKGTKDGKVGLTLGNILFKDRSSISDKETYKGLTREKQCIYVINNDKYVTEKEKTSTEPQGRYFVFFKRDIDQEMLAPLMDENFTETESASYRRFSGNLVNENAKKLFLNGRIFVPYDPSGRYYSVVNMRRWLPELFSSVEHRKGVPEYWTTVNYFPDVYVRPRFRDTTHRINNQAEWALKTHGIAESTTHVRMIQERIKFESDERSTEEIRKLVHYKYEPQYILNVPDPESSVKNYLVYLENLETPLCSLFRAALGRFLYINNHQTMGDSGSIPVMAIMMKNSIPTYYRFDQYLQMIRPGRYSTKRNPVTPIMMGEQYGFDMTNIYETFLKWHSTSKASRVPHKEHGYQWKNQLKVLAESVRDISPSVIRQMAAQIPSQSTEEGKISLVQPRDDQLLPYGLILSVAVAEAELLLLWFRYATSLDNVRQSSKPAMVKDRGVGAWNVMKESDVYSSENSPEFTVRINASEKPEGERGRRNRRAGDSLQEYVDGGFYVIVHRYIFKDNEKHMQERALAMRDIQRLYDSYLKEYKALTKKHWEMNNDVTEENVLLCERYAYSPEMMWTLNERTQLHNFMDLVVSYMSTRYASVFSNVYISHSLTNGSSEHGFHQQRTLSSTIKNFYENLSKKYRSDVIPMEDRDEKEKELLNHIDLMNEWAPTIDQRKTLYEAGVLDEDTLPPILELRIAKRQSGFMSKKNQFVTYPKDKSQRGVVKRDNGQIDTTDSWLHQSFSKVRFSSGFTIDNFDPSEYENYIIHAMYRSDLNYSFSLGMILKK